LDSYPKWAACPFQRQGEFEGEASWQVLGPNAPTMRFYDAFADR
jgi:hypothetical protein